MQRTTRDLDLSTICGAAARKDFQARLTLYLLGVVERVELSVSYRLLPALSCLRTKPVADIDIAEQSGTGRCNRRGVRDINRPFISSHRTIAIRR